VELCPVDTIFFQGVNLDLTDLEIRPLMLHQDYYPRILVPIIDHLFLLFQSEHLVFAGTEYEFLASNEGYGQPSNITALLIRFIICS
jgi:hypothetical protein